MAAPNIASVTGIIGKTSAVALTTSPQAVANNPVSSGKVLKVNTLYVSNVDGAANASVTVSYYSQDDIGGTATKIADAIVVPPNATLVVVSKEAPIYLEENRSIGALASANGDLEIVCSYEEIS